MTRLLSNVNSRVVLALEGGYYIDVLKRSIVECTRVLLGETVSLPEIHEPCKEAKQTIENVCWKLSSHWDCFSKYRRDGIIEYSTEELSQDEEEIKQRKIYNNLGLSKTMSKSKIVIHTTKKHQLDSDKLFIYIHPQKTSANLKFLTRANELKHSIMNVVFKDDSVSDFYDHHLKHTRASILSMVIHGPKQFCELVLKIVYERKWTRDSDSRLKICFICDDGFDGDLYTKVKHCRFYICDEVKRNDPFYYGGLFKDGGDDVVEDIFEWFDLD